MTRTQCLTASALALFLLMHPGDARSQALQKLADDSTLIFVGTATGLTGDQNAAAVSVDRIVQSTDFFRLNPPKQVFVVTKRPLAKGEQRLFFTRGSTLGASVIVEELARFDDGDVEDLLPTNQKGNDRVSDAALIARLRQVEIVVTARVAAVRALRQRRPLRITEHDPQWREAVLEITDTLKGTPAQRLVVLFATSMDVMWYRSPRLKEGQTGIFLLTVAPAGLTTTRQYAVVDPLDVLPLTDLDRLRTLLSRIQ